MKGVKEKDQGYCLIKPGAIPSVFHYLSGIAFNGLTHSFTYFYTGLTSVYIYWWLMLKTPIQLRYILLSI